MRCVTRRVRMMFESVTHSLNSTHSTHSTHNSNTQAGTFKIALQGTHERDKWMQWVEFCISRINFRNRREELDKTASNASLTQDIRKMPTFLRPRGLTASQLYTAEKKILKEMSRAATTKDADEDQLCDLVVILHEGTEIRRVSETIVGRDPVSPFVSVTVKSQTRRTIVVPADPQPKWNEGFTFRMSRGESATSHVRVNVYVVTVSLT